MKVLKYLRYFIKNAWHVFLYKVFKKKKRVDKFLKYKNITREYSDEVLTQMINSGVPFCAVRFGAVELSCINNYEKKMLGLKRKYKDSVKYSMKNNAGFFPCEEFYFNQYVKTLQIEMKKVDILGISGLHMEDYFYEKMCGNAKVIRYDAFEPIDKKWLSSLRGKRVLVVSSFVKDMQKQLERKVRPFKDNLLQEIDFVFVEAVQTIGDEMDDRFDNWFEALDYMKMEILKKDFDIALIGAGSYGTPLCTFVKRLGKQAIQTGGATPLLFGIIGNRWRNRDYVSKYLSDDWIRPSRLAKGQDKVEKGCYW